MSREERLGALRTRLLQLMPHAGRFESCIPGLSMTRFDQPQPAQMKFCRPTAEVVAGGRKRCNVGGKTMTIGSGDFAALGLDLPGVFEVVGASPEEPYLSVSLRLDSAEVAALLAEAPHLSENDPKGVTDEEAAQGKRPRGAPDTPAADAAEASEELLDAVLRLVSLCAHPERLPLFGEACRRETLYYLLEGPLGPSIRSYSGTGTQAALVARAVGWLREHFRETLIVEELAKISCMAPSTFHRHFKAVTGLSPVQFQKQLRLLEAERLMLAEGMSVDASASAVGYESASQFSREYKRFFGASPRQDIKVKATAGAQPSFALQEE